MHTRSGSALVITLGLLAVLGLLVIGYVYSARTERFAARHARDRVTARQFVDLALNAALESITSNTAGHGSAAIFDHYIDNPAIHPIRSTDGDSPNILDFYQRGTNQIPLHFHDELQNLAPDWIPIEGRSETHPYAITGTNGYISYAIFNCSGLLDANYATSNQLAWLTTQEDPEITDLGLFLQDRARATATNGLVTQYLDLHDLRLRSRGLAEQPRNVFTWSYDPGPDVTVTNGNVYSNRDVQLAPKWDVNSWTTGIAIAWDDRTDPTDQTDLTDHYRSNDHFLNTWLPEVTNRFAAVGLANPQALAWNLVNFMDPDRIPQGPDGHIAWQEPWPVEDVPLINEVAVGMVPLEDDYFDDGIAKPNHYAPGIELWFPFANNRITEADEAQLVVAVYTNWVPDHFANDTGWTNDVVYPSEDEPYGFTFSNAIPEMAQGTITEFVTVTKPPPYVSFPVAVTNAVAVAGPPVNDVNDVNPRTYVPVTGGTDASELVVYDPAATLLPSAFYRLVSTNLFLPLGVASYYTYLTEQRDAQTVWVRSQVTVTNTIHLLARVKLGEHWVDEAAGYHPGGDGPRTNLLVFTEPCGYEVNDPRRNGYRGDWHRYLPADRATPAWDEASTESQPVCSLNGATNLITNPWHIPYGQGLPLMHFNRLLNRAGEIGYIQQPESYPHHSEHSLTLTNLWQSISLADPTLLATNTAGFAFTAGSVLEFFTARTTNNAPVRGLVHFSTTHTNVVRALAADLPVGWGVNLAYLGNNGIDWMEQVFFDAQKALYDGSVPIGVGDMCLGFGLVPDFAAASAMVPDEDTLRWQGSLGSDTKEDLLRGLAERISFRQHVFVICLAGKTTAPSGRTTSIQRAVATVLRDAYTGRWKVVSWEWL